MPQVISNIIEKQQTSDDHLKQASENVLGGTAEPLQLKPVARVCMGNCPCEILKVELLKWTNFLGFGNFPKALVVKPD